MTATAAKFTVTRTETPDGRFAYAVNGTELRTAKAKYALAITGSGNEHDPSGYWLQLTNSYATANRTLAKYRNLPGFDDMTLVDIVEGSL